jgi:hypothetical protein
MPVTAPREGAKNPRRRWLWPVLLLELAATFLAQLPTSYDFATFVFFDPGVSLRSDKLIAQGYLPTTDFGYPYGLLPLIIGRAFFALSGRTPAAYLAFMFLTQVVMVTGMWRLARQWSWPAIGLLIAALPHAIIPMYLSLTHPLEAALLIHAVADLAAGRRARALALATVCIFVKPAMTYGLGLALVVWLIARSVRRSDHWVSLASSFLPTLGAGVTCALAAVVYFGFAPLMNTLLPLAGRKSYQALDFGFFGNGRRFWWPEASGAAEYVKYYLLTPAGFWLICALLLALFGLRSLFKLFRRSAEEDETMVTVAACHFFFIFVLFGWPGSWTYYSYLLVIGIGLGLTIYRAPPAFALALILAALIGHTQRYEITADAWRWRERSPETAGLWAYPEQRAEWMRARAIAGEREIFFLDNGCPELLFPGVRGPVSFFLSPDAQTPVEIERIRRQLEEAEVVVTFNQGLILDPWYWNEFAKQRAEFVETWQGTSLTVHERKRK